MAGELRLDQHLPSKLVDAYVWRDATQAEVWQVSEAAFAADSLYAREHGAIALVAQTPNTDGTVDYVGNLPAGLPAGAYWVSYYQRVGASVSLSDYGPLAGEQLVPPLGGVYTVYRADGPTLTVTATTPADAVVAYRQQIGTIVTPAPFIVTPVS